MIVHSLTVSYCNGGNNSILGFSRPVTLIISPSAMKYFATDGNGEDPDHLDPMRLLLAAAAVRDGGDLGENFSVQLSSAQSDP